MSFTYNALFHYTLDIYFCIRYLSIIKNKNGEWNPLLFSWEPDKMRIAETNIQGHPKWYSHILTIIQTGYTCTL